MAESCLVYDLTTRLSERYVLVWDTGHAKNIRPCHFFGKTCPSTVCETTLLLPTFREKIIFPDQGNYRVRVPLEFKILASLRLLGRGNCVDGINEFSHIPNSSVLHYFHRFVDGFVDCCYNEFVRMPEGEDLAHFENAIPYSFKSS